MKDNPLISIYMPTLEPPTTGDSGDKIGPAPGLQQLGDDHRG